MLYFYFDNMRALVVLILDGDWRQLVDHFDHNLVEHVLTGIKDGKNVFLLFICSYIGAVQFLVFLPITYRSIFCSKLTLAAGAVSS